MGTVILADQVLANPPVALVLDEGAVERLAELVTAWALVGLAPPG
jgi:hypothetical protein